MEKRICAVAAFLLFGCAGAQAQDAGKADLPADGTAVYLRSPEERLSRLASFLELDKRRKDKMRRILKQVDAAVRRDIADGNKKIRALLDDDDKEKFDGLRDDTEGAPQSPQTRHRLVTTPHRDSEGGRGPGGGGRGQGRGGSGQRGGGRGMGGSGQGGARGRCGDGLCDEVEKMGDMCPQDCGQSQGQPTE